MVEIWSLPSRVTPRALVDPILDRAEQAVGHDQSDAAPAVEVDQLVAQAQVEQGVLPLLDPRRRRAGLIAGRPARGQAGGRPWPGSSIRRDVVEDLNAAVVGPYLRGQRHDPVEAALPDVHHAVHRAEIAGQECGVGRAVARLERPRRFGDGDRGGLHQPDQVQVDQVDDVADLRLRGAGERVFVPPVAEERVSVHHEQQRPQPRLFQGSGEHHRGVQAGAEPATAALRPGCGPAARRRSSWPAR